MSVGLPISSTPFLASWISPSFCYAILYCYVLPLLDVQKESEKIAMASKAERYRGNCLNGYKGAVQGKPHNRIMPTESVYQWFSKARKRRWSGRWAPADGSSGTILCQSPSKWQCCLAWCRFCRAFSAGCAMLIYHASKWTWTCCARVQSIRFRNRRYEQFSAGNERRKHTGKRRLLRRTLEKTWFIRRPQKRNAFRLSLHWKRVWVEYWHSFRWTKLTATELRFHFEKQLSRFDSRSRRICALASLRAISPSSTSEVSQPVFLISYVSVIIFLYPVGHDEDKHYCLTSADPRDQIETPDAK